MAYKDGHVFWNRPTSKLNGKEVGSIKSDGYRYFTIKGKCVNISRIAWVLVFGEWPKSTLDHINRNPLDNRIENLRESTGSQNGANRTNARTKTFRGILKSGRGFKSRVVCQRQIIGLGTFATEIEAAQAYNKKAFELFGEFAVLNDVPKGDPIPLNRHLAFGEIKTYKQWAKDPRCQCCHSTLLSRVGLGWDLEKSIITPPSR